MKERLKTLLLFSLVVFGVFMAYKVWINPDNERIFEEKREKSDENISLKEYTVPDKAMINFSRDYHSLIFDARKDGLWDSFNDFFISVFTDADVKTIKISEDEYFKAREDRGTVFHFVKNFSISLLLRALDVGEVNKNIKLLEYSDEVFISAGGYAMFKTEHTYYKVSSYNFDYSKSEDIIKKIREDKNLIYYYSVANIIKKKSGLYIPYDLKFKMYDFDVKNKIDVRNDIVRYDCVKKFLSVEPEYVKEIREKDDSNIYLHENEVLKIKNDGSIEYYKPLSRNYYERNMVKSFESAIKFIKYSGVEEDGLYLSSIKEIKSDKSVGYEFCFDLKLNNMRLYFDGKNRNFLTVEVFDDSVRRLYTKNKVFIKTAQINNNISDPQTVLEKNINDFKKLGIEEKKLIENIDRLSPAYLFKDEKSLLCVWCVEVKNKRLFYNLTGNKKEGEYGLEQS